MAKFHSEAVPMVYRRSGASYSALIQELDDAGMAIMNAVKPKVKPSRKRQRGQDNPSIFVRKPTCVEEDRYYKGLLEDDYMDNLFSIKHDNSEAQGTSSSAEFEREVNGERYYFPKGK